MSARRALRAALCVALAGLGLAGCGGTERRSGTTARDARSARPLDPIDSLSLLVEGRLQAAVDHAPGETGADSGAADAGAAAVELVRAVLASREPVGGWAPDALVAALLERQVAAQAREIRRGKEPWVLLISDPRRPEQPELALLVQPSEEWVAQLAIEPFAHPFQIVSWTDSLGPALLVTGTRRAHAGLQPAAWVLRLPAGSSAAGAPREPIVPAGVWPLAAEGAARVSFTRSDPDSAPRVLVKDSSLPNPLFDECAACPHVRADVEYRYDGRDLVAERTRVRRTPYAAFVGFINALVAHDEPSAAGYAAGHDILERARTLGFDRRPGGGRWRIAPGMAASSLDQVYLRGQEGAFRVLLAPGDSGFVVTAISPTTFELD